MTYAQRSAIQPVVGINKPLNSKDHINSVLEIAHLSYTNMSNFGIEKELSFDSSYGRVFLTDIAQVGYLINRLWSLFIHQPLANRVHCRLNAILKV